MRNIHWLVIVAFIAISCGCASRNISLGGGQKMKFVRIPALNGWCGKYEVTNGEYRRFKPDHDSKMYKDYSLNGDRQPVVEVSWSDTQEFIFWMQANCRVPKGYRLRLPSKEEWMTIARCGDEREYPWGNNWPPPNDLNYHGGEGVMDVEKIAGHQDFYPVSSPVEKSGRNEWGLCGIGGNVWEWTDEKYKTGSHVMRGAFWGDTSSKWLCCDRRLVPSNDRNYFGGFRLLLIPEKEKGVSPITQ